LQAADMWKDPFPQADVHRYGDTLLEWPKEKGHFLARKSFASLPSGGMIVLREVLFNDELI
jgi:acetylserotonin N-methyltransferase